MISHTSLPKERYIKGQLGVPLTVHPWYLLFSLGILGDEKTHKYPLDRAYIGISHRGTLRYVGRGTSNYPLNIELTQPLNHGEMTDVCFRFWLGAPCKLQNGSLTAEKVV